MRTIREKLTAGLEKHGWTRDFSARSGKYHVFTRSDFTSKVFLGKSGAMRVGKSASNSRAVSEPVRAKYLACGDISSRAKKPAMTLADF